MKKLLYIPLVLVCFFACKNDKEEINPESLIGPLVGKWMVKETELIVNGKKVWQPASASLPVYVTIHSDGIILDADGNVDCCGSNELNINGSSFKIDPKSRIPFSGNCIGVSCVICPAQDIDHSGNEMIISYCMGPRVRYVKI
jgi:hypothetical protein